MDVELMMILYTQYLSYIETIANVMKNLQTFLNQNKDFCGMLDIDILVYIKSLDIKLSRKSNERRSSPDLQVVTGYMSDMVAMCDELRQLVTK